MDGSRTRLLALTAPLLLGLVLGVAALLAAPDTDRAVPGVLHGDLTGSARTLPSGPSALVFPRTTPPAPALEAATGAAPEPAPEPARTATRPDDAP
ncbi:hypothetical protein ACLFMI_26160 [Pseudonocardia nantongensis]|uniref:hypothetical protein n=1 Tax=Pseudonocardia nantongensis TaxID=1181885 RepID=UPI00397E6CF6